MILGLCKFWDTDYNCSEYPVTQDFTDKKRAKDWVPRLLMTFAKHILLNDLQQMAICHSIVQAAQLRSALSPILFGVGVSLDHAFGSRSLIDMLARLGFSASYGEVTRYKQSAVQCDTEEIPLSFPSHFTQWAGDNMDRNINTLDGLNTFHGMDIVSMSAACGRNVTGRFTDLTGIPRLKRSPAATVVRDKGIPVLSLPEQSALSTLKVKPFADLQPRTFSASSAMYDIVWQCGWFFCDSAHPRPYWSGYTCSTLVLRPLSIHLRLKFGCCLSLT